MPQRRYSDVELEAAVEELTDPEALRDAQDLVTRAAPGLQRLLNQALFEGGWFGRAHDEQVLRGSTLPDLDERLRAVRTLLAEETRLAMLVGVAVGYELRARLERDSADANPEEGPT